MKKALLTGLLSGAFGLMFSAQSDGNTESDFSKYLTPIDSAIKITSEIMEERLDGTPDNPIPIKTRSIATSISSPGFSPYVIDFDPMEAFFTRNPAEPNPKLEILKSKERHVFNGVNKKTYDYGQYDESGNFEPNNILIVQKLNPRIIDDFVAMYSGRFFFVSEFPFFDFDDARATVIDILTSSREYKDRGFPACTVEQSGGNIIIKSDTGTNYIECVLSGTPLMFKSFKNVLKKSKSNHDEWTIAYEFSGKMLLPWNGIAVPEKIVRTSFHEGKGNRLTAILKSAELVKDFDMKQYDLPPKKGWTVYDQTRGLTYKIGDTKEYILKSIQEAYKDK